MALGIMLPVWGHTGYAIQLIPDATAREENMFTTDHKLLYCMCRSARTYFTFVLVRSQEQNCNESFIKSDQRLIGLELHGNLATAFHST